ncbi:Uma2 family endonuclease [Mucilaginibacter gracilis]|uniref:Uma2 family endonuclease n=1 Tax=Mucilaginibacter gracilis TaxID=423350 RepID=A0A495JAA4_9SPHI|nr:Uma2 family endonuclease [Mucilaginibacter gracilis]RKR85324.1 Uma2 family endonuclease [Mucilaginibacter gracilis]
MKQILDIPRTAMEVFNMLPEGTRCEVIDNTLYMSPSPTSDHQELLGDIFLNLTQAVKANQLGKVYISPLDVYLDDGLTVVQPDVVFISTAKLSQIEKKGIVGSPDIVLEVLSSNKDYDKKKKFELYQKNQIPEYIIIDPENKNVWHYLLRNGNYEQLPSADGQLTVKSINAQFTF